MKVIVDQQLGSWGLMPDHTIHQNNCPVRKG